MLLLQLRLPAARSLKDKRQVIKSVIGRVRNRFNVAAAEVEDHDRWGIAGIGFVCVSTNAVHARGLLESVVSFVESERLDVEVIDTVYEVTQAF